MKPKIIKTLELECLKNWAMNSFSLITESLLTYFYSNGVFDYLTYLQSSKKSCKKSKYIKLQCPNLLRLCLADHHILVFCHDANAIFVTSLPYKKSSVTTWKLLAVEDTHQVGGNGFYCVLVDIGSQKVQTNLI